MNAEDKIRRERDKLSLAVKLSVLDVIKVSEVLHGVQLTKREKHIAIADTMFEMLANVCAINGLDLDNMIKVTLAESGSDAIEHIFEHKSCEQNNTGMQEFAKFLQRICEELDGEDPSNKNEDNKGGQE